jgi:transcriptional regulator with XRE-family HTH domain
MIAGIFGQVLRELRENKKLSQERLAEYSKLDQTYISLLERGLRQPSLTTFIHLSDALQIKPSFLMKKVQEQVLLNITS